MVNVSPRLTTVYVRGGELRLKTYLLSCPMSPNSGSILWVNATDGAFLGVMNLHELADVVVKVGDVAMVLGHLASDILVGGEESAHVNESPYDFNADLNGFLAAQEDGKDGDALLSEGIERTATAALA